MCLKMLNKMKNVKMVQLINLISITKSQQKSFQVTFPIELVCSVCFVFFK